MKNASSSPTRFPKKLSLLLMLAATLLAFFIVREGLYKIYTQKEQGPVVGNLGGVPVSIPRNYARFVEYNGDPGFLEKKRFTPPKRTHQSILRGFGFRVRYPDMLSEDQRTEAEKDIFTTMWMRVIVNTGEDYGSTGDEALDNYKNYYLDSERPCNSKCFHYVPLPDKTYGLVGYTPTGSGVDVEKRSINFGRGTDSRDKNIYFDQNKSGRVTTFIECNNRTHAAADCKHSFDLSPKMKAHVKVSYRKGLLRHWREIEKSVRELLYSFRDQGVNSCRDQGVNS